MKFNPIAIVGQSCILPGALNPQELWAGLIENRNFLSEANYEDWNLDPTKLLITENDDSILDKIWNSIGGHIRGFDELFDASGFRADASFIQTLDPLFQWTLHCGREALKGISWERSRNRTAIVLGNLSYPNAGLNKLAQAVWSDKIDDPNLNWRNRFIAAYPAQFLSESLGLQGPAFCVDAACASSLYALKNACDILNNHEADLAISGGINASEGSFLNLGFTSLRALSRSGKVKPFSQDADGLVPSRGAAFVTLRRLNDAMRLGEPILGVIRGIGLSNDGRTGSLLSPSSPAQQLAIRKAYELAGFDPSELSYLEVHATGTLVGDRCELTSLLDVFKANHHITLGSLKCNMGHLLAASGTAALLKIIGAFKNNIIPSFASISNPLQDLLDSQFEVPSKARTWDTSRPRIAAVNAFGFGGNNAHLIVEEFSPLRHKNMKEIKSTKNEPLAIVGIGINWGKIRGKEALHEALIQNEKVASSNLDSFELDLNTLNFPPNDIAGILPQHLLLIPTLAEAIEDLKKTPSENTGILVGLGSDPEACRFKLRLDLKLENKFCDDNILAPLTAIRTLGCMPNIPANRFNLMQNWKGASYTVMGEELSGLHGIQIARRALESHEVDCMIVAAVDLSCEPVHREAVRHCFPESKHTPADGAAAIVMKRLSDAEKDGDLIYFVLDNETVKLQSSDELDSKLGYAHAASSLLHLVAKLVNPTTPVISSGAASPVISSGAKRSRETACIAQQNTIKTKAHLPPILLPKLLPLAPKLPPALPLYVKRNPVLFDTEALLEHASGKLSKIFGDTFEETDSYTVRVRMPEPPLLLTDRILKIDAQKASMGCGTITTETDIPENAWYLHHGRMLAGPAIEAGQSDLFLISYLGVDFETKGERAYRLLGCEAKFLRDLPEVGETLHFKITIDRHVKNGKTRLFFFHYDCWIGDQLFLQVKNGQAGFFSREELDASQGVILDSKLLHDSVKLSHSPVSNIRSSFLKEDVLAFSNGDAFSCFGYANLASHTRTPCIPSGNNLLFDEVPLLDPKGYLKVTRVLSENDWFFAGHFKNDPCMPGTLMTEMAFQALSFFMTALGYTLNSDGFRFIPAIGEACKLTCRGQILPQSKFIEMEVFVKEILQTPTILARADVLLTVDGLKALLAENLSVQLIPDWIERSSYKDEKNDSSAAKFEGIYCNETQIAHTVHGKPSMAFGPLFSRFDNGSRPARLPAYPYTFLSRICKIEAPYCGMQAGSRILSEWDIPRNHPLLTPHAPHIPFSVILEALLQPCGWLASYIGCPLASEKELFFRNLEGELLLHFQPEFKDKIQVDVTVSSLVRLQDTIIVEFKVSAFTEEKCFMEVKTRFGYFTVQALSDQKGLRISKEEQDILDTNMDTAELLSPEYDGKYRSIFSPYFQLLDKIKILENRTVVAEKTLSPKDWYFKAHFFQDPVMPGSLGLEAMFQSLKIFLLNAHIHNENQFAPLEPGQMFTWKYRGQVLPRNKKITVLTHLTSFSENPYSQADSCLIVDGIKIYEAKIKYRITKLLSSSKS